jgi:hypothetical protein
MSPFQSVADHQHAFGVIRLCKALGVSRSGFRRWLDAVGIRAAKTAADAALTERIRAIHTASARTSAGPRVTAELREMGTKVDH